MQTELFIGPLIERSGKFSYDTFSLPRDCAAHFAIHVSRQPDTTVER